MNSARPKSSGHPTSYENVFGSADNSQKEDHTSVGETTNIRIDRQKTMHNASRAASSYHKRQESKDVSEFKAQSEIKKQADIEAKVISQATKEMEQRAKKTAKWKKQSQAKLAKSKSTTAIGTRK